MWLREWKNLQSNQGQSRICASRNCAQIPNAPSCVSPLLCFSWVHGSECQNEHEPDDKRWNETFHVHTYAHHYGPARAHTHTAHHVFFGCSPNFAIRPSPTIYMFSYTREEKTNPNHCTPSFTQQPSQEKMTSFNDSVYLWRNKLRNLYVMNEWLLAPIPYHTDRSHREQ